MKFPRQAAVNKLRSGDEQESRCLGSANDISPSDYCCGPGRRCSGQCVRIPIPPYGRYVCAGVCLPE